MNEAENHAENHDAIIYTHWPQVSRRERMPLESRAKIFMPFSALKGLTQAIQRQVQAQENQQEGNEGGKNDSPFSTYR